MTWTLYGRLSIRADGLILVCNFEEPQLSAGAFSLWFEREAGPAVDGGTAEPDHRQIAWGNGHSMAQSA
jgi:hypothetical protein